MCGGDDSTEHSYACSFGTPVSSTTTVENMERCQSCDDEYSLEEGRCI